VVRDDVAGITLDPKKLEARHVTPDEVASALKIACRRIDFQSFGTRKLAKNLQLKLTQPPSNLGDYPIKIDDQKQRISLRDLIEGSDIIYLEKGVELGAKNYDVNSYLDGQPAVTMAVFQLPGSNALDTAKAIKDEMAKLKGKFPEGVDYRIV